MEYLPESYIHNNDMPMPVNGENAEEFWIKLGWETKNLKKWILNIQISILISRYGKSFRILSIPEFKQISHHLDNLVCRFYPNDLHYIEWNTHNVNVVNVFYGTSNMIDYPTVCTGNDRKYEKMISSRDKFYMEQFVVRMGEYLTYMETNIDTIASIKRNQEPSLDRHKKQRILKNIFKTREKIVKFADKLNTLTVNDEY